MTGFGKATRDCAGKRITVEVKSLNSKQMDLQVKLPLSYRAAEMDMRAHVAKLLQRGKVEVYVTAEQTDGTAPVSINVRQVEAYRKQIEQICADVSLPQPGDWWGALLRLPEVMHNSGGDEPTSQAELDAVREALDAALDGLNDFRAREGQRLEGFFEEKIAAIQAEFAEVDRYEAGRVERVKARLTEALAKLEGVDYDSNRLEQELIFYIEKLDITEEKTRLRNHIDYFLDTLHACEQGQGKKLGFITQEMGREINTLGSKANQADLQQVVVRMKDQLEQIKEQVLNVL